MPPRDFWDLLVKLKVSLNFCIAVACVMTYSLNTTFKLIIIIIMYFRY